MKLDDLNYRVIYLVGVRRAWHPGCLTLEQAKKLVHTYKRRGTTAWVTGEDGGFVPVEGALRQPRFLE